MKKRKDENRQQLISNIHWSKEQENEFNVRYFLEYLFSWNLEPLLDKNPYNDALVDKLLLNIYNVLVGLKVRAFIIDGVMVFTEMRIIRRLAKT